MTSMTGCGQPRREAPHAHARGGLWQTAPGLCASARNRAKALVDQMDPMVRMAQIVEVSITKR